MVPGQARFLPGVLLSINLIHNDMKQLTFRVTATVVKDITVDVDDENLTEEEIEDTGREMAHEQFNVLCDGQGESYSEDSALIIEG